MEIDKIPGEVSYLGIADFSGFPLQICSAFGIDHVKKSEMLVRDEFQRLMNEIEERQHAKR